MYKRLIFLLLACVAIFSHADVKELYYTGFNDWTAQGAGNEVVVEQTTNFSNENFTFTMYQTRISPTTSAYDGSTTGGASEEMSVGCLMAEKNQEGTITISALKSITKVVYIHAATGNNRGFGLKVSVDGGLTWDIVYDTMITTNARSGVKVEVNIVEKLSALNKSVGQQGVMLQFYNFTSSQNAYLQDLWIYGEHISDAEQVQLTTSLNIAEAGSIKVSPPADSYDINTTVTLTAEAVFGYEFVSWTDGETGEVLSTDSTFDLLLDGDKDVVANFRKLQLYKVEVKTSSRNGKYSITPEPEEGLLPQGTEVVVSAIDTRVGKFTSWSDGTTDRQRKFVLNEDVEFMANFADENFIVGWDFDPEPSDRNGMSAYYYASVANQGSLKMYKSDGCGIAWLNNEVDGKKCIIKWATDIENDNRYFQAQFSTIDYENIQVESYVHLGRYSYYDTQKLQYSIDGETFNDVATITYEGVRKWHELFASLPKECNNQETVYLRWVSTGIVNINGNDGTGLADVFIMATPVVTYDGVAPSVIATTPVEGSTTASATGKVIFTFDKQIKYVDGYSITLNEEVLQPQIVSNSLIVNYSGLEYATKYNVVIPAGAIANMSDVATTEDIKLTFTTMSRPVPQARVFNAIVDQSLEATIPATKDAIGQYKTIWEAVEAAPSDCTEPWLIFIKSGYYNDENGDAYVKSVMATTNKEYYYTDAANNESATAETSNPGNILYIYKPYIHLIGQDKESVTIAQDRIAGGDKNRPDKHWYDVSNSATLVVMANDFYAENITIDNEWWTKSAAAGPQALALYVEADRVTFNNCNIRSYQDTYLSPKTRNKNAGNTAAAGYSVYHYRDRNYLKNCLIEGAVDFIYGGGDVYFDECTINIVRDKGGYIVAPCHYNDLTSTTGETNCTRWGYVFKNTTITAPNETGTQVYFGRPWQNNPITVFIDTECRVKTYDGIWYEKMGGIPKLWAVYNMWNADGEAMNTTSRSTYTTDGVNYVEVKNYLTAEEAATYTIENVLAGDGSDNAAVGHWNPMPIVEKTATPMLNTPVIENGKLKLSWIGDDYAICYVVTINDEVVDITTETEGEYEVGKYGSSIKVGVQSVNEYGALSNLAEVNDIFNGDTSVEDNCQEEVSVFAANGKIYIRGIHQDTNIALYDLAGRMIETFVSRRNVSIDMSDGYYIVKVENNVKQVVVK